MLPQRRYIKHMALTVTAVCDNLSKEPTHDLQATTIMHGLTMFKVLNTPWTPAVASNIKIYRLYYPCTLVVNYVVYLLSCLLIS
jgi:hypothetical protein